MKAIMAQAEEQRAASEKQKQEKVSNKEIEHHDDARKVEVKEKLAETVHVIQPKSEPANKKVEVTKVEEPSWSAETEKTCILPSMLEPQTPEPVKQIEHHDDANLEQRDGVEVEDVPSVPTIEVQQPKVDVGIKLFVGMGGTFFAVALAASVYTALKVTGVM